MAALPITLHQVNVIRKRALMVRANSRSLLFKQEQNSFCVWIWRPSFQTGLTNRDFKEPRPQSASDSSEVSARRGEAGLPHQLLAQPIPLTECTSWPQVILTKKSCTRCKSCSRLAPNSSRVANEVDRNVGNPRAWRIHHEGLAVTPGANRQQGGDGVALDFGFDNAVDVLPRKLAALAILTFKPVAGKRHADSASPNSPEKPWDCSDDANPQP